MMLGVRGATADISKPHKPIESRYARPPAPAGPWYIKKDRTYIAQRDDETILKVIAVDNEKWNAYNKARRSIYPCIDMPELLQISFTPPWNSLVLMCLPCICISCPWSNFCTRYKDIPFPEGARGREALVVTDVGIRGWSEKIIKPWFLGPGCPGVGVKKEWEPVGITWCVCLSVCLSVYLYVYIACCVRHACLTERN